MAELGNNLAFVQRVAITGFTSVIETEILRGGDKKPCVMQQHFTQSLRVGGRISVMVLNNNI